VSSPAWGLGQNPGRPRISVQFQLKRWPLIALKSGGIVPPPLSTVGRGVRVPLLPPKIRL